MARDVTGKLSLLGRVPLFEGLSQRQLREIARLADEVAVPDGKRLATAGEAGHELYVIVEGIAEIRLPGGRRRRLGPGEFFGEMSLVDGGPRSATVDAATAMRFLVLGRREFWQALGEAPLIVRKIMQTLSRRLREADASVS